MTTAAEKATTIFRRPRAETGFWSWLTIVDHKKIGILYGYTAFIFFVIGGAEALLLRIHLLDVSPLPHVLFGRVVHVPIERAVPVDLHVRDEAHVFVLEDVRHHDGLRPS